MFTNKNFIKILIVPIAILFSTLGLHAQVPVFHNFEFDDQSIIQSMSDNGRWAVASGGESASARLIDIDSNSITVISGSQNTENANDVTNDGKIVVGSTAGKPACYFADKKAWKKLETKNPYVYGNVYSITPDGSLAVGVLYYGDGYNSIAALWDIQTGKLIETPGLPTKDMSHQDQDMMSFSSISADGKHILGCMSYSYLPTSLDLGGCFYFVYNVEKADYKVVGFTESDTKRWSPKCDGLIVVMSASMSNNGRYVTGNAHLAFGNDDNGNEYGVPFVYDVENDVFTGYDETAVADTYGSMVSNGGTVISVSPEGNPVREWSLRSGKYWFSFAEILKQKYSTDIKTCTGQNNTGTVNSISDDGKRLVAFPDPYCCYVVELPEALEDLGNGIKLLGSYNVTPAENSQVSHLKNITITFDRNIKAVGDTKTAEIQDADGNTIYRSVGFSTESKTLSIRFRTGTLEEGQAYKLFIPEGAIALEDDATQTNSDMYIQYSGRADEAVKPVSFYPAEGTAFSHIDYSTSPVIITFDTNIAIADNATAYLYRNDETAPFCGLTLARSANQLALYPSTTQYLYDGSSYRVVVTEGSITDVAGNNPSAEITISYSGNYVREISADDVILFSDNFNSGYGNFMQWCGDQKQPVSAMTSWDFQKGMAWGLVREDETSSDLIAASHSMYSPAGQSDDWLVLPQIYIPDMLCSVKFQSQGYLQSKQDSLKVIVWESNNVYNTLNEDIINQMKAEGVVVYNEIQNPGMKEEMLEGEWTDVKISLADFAGKNIYIAFVNDNNNQSAIFMDNLEVRHDMNFLTSLIYEESVVAKDGITIKGSIIGNNDDKAYENITLTLKDADGNTVDTYTATGLSIRKGDSHQFQFAEALPLTLGIENHFTILADVDGEQNEVKGAIKNLAFQPVKRIVLEEYTGRACGNCPLGIIAIEKLQERYGDNFLPISIHTYSNDPLSSGMGNYTSTLGLDQLGAPSGMINRGEGCYPAASAEVDDVLRFFFTGNDTEEEDDMMWADYAAQEMALPAECGIDITAVRYNEATRTFEADCEVKYALNAQNQNVNLFTVLLEDNLSQAQSNYMASYTSPDLGEWGLGGRYGQSVVTDYLHQDVCKNVSGLTINGTGGYIPSTVTAGEVYDATVSIAAPSTVQSVNNCKVIVMMINANTGKVINAARAKYVDPTGISLTPTLSEREGVMYNAAGLRVNSNYKGIVIRNGKKYFIK